MNGIANLIRFRIVAVGEPSFVGIAIIALPSGIVTAGYMDELRSRKEKKDLEHLD